MNKKIKWFLPACIAMITIGCGKDKVIVDTHNRTLINIPIAELKTLLAGNWLLKKEYICGFRPCYDTSYVTGQEDIFSFLPQDSVKRTRANGVVMVNDKATIYKSTYNNAWVYEMAGGLVSWSFQEIKNDTLIATIDYSQGSTSFLVKKP